jgi:site-specific DNA recombinase
MIEPAEPVTAAAPWVPTAWYGRSATVEDGDLSLLWQLEGSRRALPTGFVIVARFYDIGTGMQLRAGEGGVGFAPLDIPVPCDGGLADLLEEAERPDCRFTAVVCTDIDRIDRRIWYAEQIEDELSRAGVALLIADEGINPLPRDVRIRAHHDDQRPGEPAR